MNLIGKTLGGVALALLLGTSLVAPAWADKISQSGIGAPATPTAPPPTTTPGDIEIASPADAIDFGDDTSEWANDGECDDPRFSGTGAAAELIAADRLHDAADCKAAYDAGTIALVEVETVNTPPASTDTPTAPADITIATPIDAIDFGDDSSSWSKDGECDDPRFTGTGSAAELLPADIRKDATDCRAAYEAGTVTLKDAPAATATPADTPATPPADIAIATPLEAIDFGDDSSEWAKDGECDDPRFVGTGAVPEPLGADTLKDASDCKAAYAEGTVTLKAEASPTGATTPSTAMPQPFDYGADWSKWANDGECDDLRFSGPGTDKKLLSDDTLGDATDCKTLEAAGKVTIRTVYTPEYAAGAPYDSAGISFGDNASDYANDTQCDDPRFEGPGAATLLLEDDREHDAADCKTAYEAGLIVLLNDA